MKMDLTFAVDFKLIFHKWKNIFASVSICVYNLLRLILSKDSTQNAIFGEENVRGNFLADP